MPQRLRVQEILTVGFVDKGDDPEAEIVFFKRRDEEDTKHTKDTKAGVKQLIAAMATKLGFAKNDSEYEEVLEELLAEGAQGSSVNNDGLNPNGDGHMTFDVSKLEGSELEAFNAAVQAAVDERATGEGEGGEAALPNDLPEAVTKRMDEFQKALDEQTSRAEAAESKTQDLVDQRERESYIRKVGELGLPGANPDDFAEILRKAEGALSDEEREKFTEVLKGASNAIAEGSLLGEMGSGGRGATTVEAEVATLAKEIKANNPKLSDEMAKAKVWHDRPDLFKRYRDERPILREE